MKCILSLSLVAFTSLASTVAAERQPFEGRVVNPKSLPIHRARVVLYRLDNPRARVTTITDENGAFSLPLETSRDPTRCCRIIPIRSIPPPSYPSRSRREDTFAWTCSTFWASAWSR